MPLTGIIGMDNDPQGAKTVARLLNCIIFKMNEKGSSRILTVTSNCVNVEYCFAAVCIYGPFSVCRTKYNIYFDSITCVYN